jgi:hypothetical protein
LKHRLKNSDKTARLVSRSQIAGERVPVSRYFVKIGFVALLFTGCLTRDFGIGLLLILLIFALPVFYTKILKKG